MRHIPATLIPRLIWNRTRRAFGLRQGFHVGGKTFWLWDEKTSLTLDVVLLEHAAGFYKPPITLRAGDTVLDLGAHVGGFTIPLAHKYPDTKFICVEPDPVNYKNLCRNIKNAGLRNVDTIHAAIEAHGGSVSVSHDTTNTGATKTIVGSGIGAYTLTGIRALLGLEKIRLLKVDIEGAEHSALANADWTGIESLIAEIHDQRGRDIEPTIKRFQEVKPHRLFIEPKPMETLEG